MIAALALVAALTLTAPVDDVQLPTCAVGEEAVPFEDGYVCGPADPALPEPSPLPTIAPEELPAFTAQPLPVEVPAAPVAQPAPLGMLAETGVVEDRLGALAHFGIGILGVGAGLLCSVWIAGLRRRRDARSSYARLRDANGYYTKLKPTDPGYPYGQSEDPATAALLPVELPPKILELPDHSVERVLGVGETDGEHDLRSGVGADVAEHLQPAAAAGDAVADGARLSPRIADVTHDASPSVLDGEVAPSPSSDQTVGETADTAVMGSAFPFGSQRAVGGRGAAASSGPAAPHSDLEGEQQ